MEGTLVLAVILSISLPHLCTAETIQVGITHYGDVLGQLQSFQKGSNPPKTCTPIETNCVGGVAELMGHIKNIEETDFSHLTNVSKLRFSTGNLISGDNGWLSALNADRFDDQNGYKSYGKMYHDSWPSFSQENYYLPNATVLGVREFDGGIESLNNYLNEWRPIKPIVSNARCMHDIVNPEKTFCEHIQKFQVLGLGKMNIGIVGFVDPLVMTHSEPGKIEFSPIVDGLKTVISDHLGTKTIFAIGSGVLQTAKDILDNIPQVKLVILGDINENGSEYLINHNNGYIVSSGKHAATLGRLLLDIDVTTGDISKADGKFINNDATVQADDNANRKILELASSVKGNADDKKVGVTKVNLNATKSSCWKSECLLGNLITDSMVHCAFNNKSEIAKNLPAELVAIWHSGSIGGSSLPANRDISLMDVFKWLVYPNKATLVSLRGSTLRKIFNDSAQVLGSEYAKWGQFLQVSDGLQVVYRTDSNTATVESLKTLQLENGNLHLVDVDDSKKYTLIVPSHLSNGRNVYQYLPGMLESIGTGHTHRQEIAMDSECMKNYITAMGVITTGSYRRIFINEIPPEISTNHPTPSTEETDPTSTDSSTHETLQPTNPTSTSPSTSTNSDESGSKCSEDKSILGTIVLTVGVTLLVVFIILGSLFALAARRSGRRANEMMRYLISKDKPKPFHSNSFTAGI